MTLKSILKGAKEKIYKVMEKRFRATGQWDSDPDGCYFTIKTRLMKFVESTLEKRTRLNKEWAALRKGKSTALEFEAAWEELLAEMETVNLGKGPDDLYIQYLESDIPKV